MKSNYVKNENVNRTGTKTIFQELI